MKNIFLFTTITLVFTACGNSGDTGSTSNAFTVDDIVILCKEESVTSASEWDLTVENEIASTHGPSAALSASTSTLPVRLTKQVLAKPLKLPFGTYDGNRDGKVFQIKVIGNDALKSATVGGKWYIATLNIDSKDYSVSCRQQD